MAGGVSGGGSAGRTGRRECRSPTRSAPLTDSSHRSMMNSSRAMDSLSMLMSRWHSLRFRRLGKLLLSYTDGGSLNGDVLRQEELELLIRKGAQLRAEHIVDSDMVCVPPGGVVLVVAGARAGDAVKPHSRQIGHGKRRVTVEMVGFDEPLEQIPTHHRRFIGARRGEGRRRNGCSTGARRWKDAVASMGHSPGFRGASWDCGASSPTPTPTPTLTLTRRHPRRAHRCCSLSCLHYTNLSAA